MAGIGFELKKVFAKKGVLNAVKAYGYAAVICTGPMLLGILLLFGITALCKASGADVHTRELLTSIITYTMLSSTTITAFFNQIVTRFVSDMIFSDDNEAVLPAFWGSVLIMLTIGSVVYGTFMLTSGATFMQGLLCYTLFGELIIVWNSMNFLSAIKDYKSIFLSFFAAITVSLLLGVALLALDLPVIESLLFSVTVGYGVMLIWDVILLHRYFPKSNKSAFAFLFWMDSFQPLALSGLFMILGMFVHLIIMWYSDIGVQMEGLFFGAPQYDIPALLAYMTSLITTINFVISVEVNFYPKYRNHYSLYNDGGTIDNIKKSEREMLNTLKSELFYAALKQLVFTMLIIAVGGYILDLLPLGFDETMRGYFRTLCVAYGICAIGNMIMLIQFYFTDYKGALIGTSVFVVTTIVFTLLSLLLPSVYYGFGFLLSSLVFAIVGAVRLHCYTKRLPYYILSAQPLVNRERKGPFTALSKFLNGKLEE